MNAIYSAHTMKRQEANGFMGKISQHKDKESTFTCENYSIKMTLCAVAKIWEDTLKLFKFKYSKPADGEKNHWFGVIAPLLTYICAHKHRRDELRVDHAKMPTNRNGETESYINDRRLWNGRCTSHPIRRDFISSREAVFHDTRR